jgi:hypothetical protein
MNNMDFTAMSREQLREYVRTHPYDIAAFHTYMDMLQNVPAIEVQSMEQFEQLLQERVRKPQSE